MKKIIIIFVSTIIPILSFSQSILLRGRIIDNDSKLGIPFSNIWILNKDIGTSSLESGNFLLLIDSTIFKNEKLKVTAIGYYDTIIELRNYNKTINLQPRCYEIQEVAVYPNKKNTLVVNPIDKKMKLGYMLSSNTPLIMCRLFPYREQYLSNDFISKIMVYTKKSLKKHRFNLHIYEYDTINKKPGKELVNKNIIVSTKPELGFGISQNIIDISQYKIKIPITGLIVGVEWIMNYENLFEEEINENNGKINVKLFEKRYGPDFVITFEKDLIRWSYAKGFWHQDTYQKVLTPAISLILTD